MTKEEKIRETLIKWKDSYGRGTVIWPPQSIGKTFLAIEIIKRFSSKHPNKIIVITVPTKALLYQWEYRIKDAELNNVCKIHLYKEAIKKYTSFDLLIVDECHNACAIEASNLFKIPCKFILCITATLERLDGRHIIIEKVAPIIDRVSLEEAVDNKWILGYTEIKVIIKAPNMKDYNTHNYKFTRLMEFFNNDFKLAMACLKSESLRKNMANYKRYPLEQVTAFTFALNKHLKARIKFVEEHPSKIKIAKEIIKNKLDKKEKIILFSPKIHILDEYFTGDDYYHYHSKIKEKEANLRAFRACSSGVLCTCDSLNLGITFNDVNNIIIICNDSSDTTKTQRIGRVLSNTTKIPEIFTLVLQDTVDEAWYYRSTKDNDYITLTEHMLEEYLKGEDVYKERIEGPVMLYSY